MPAAARSKRASSSPRPKKAATLFKSVVREGRLSDKVAAQIAEAITNGKFTRGQRLPSERELCVMFDVSRTVIREAVRSLIGTGMITVTAGRGVEVSYDPDAPTGVPMRLTVKDLGELDYETVHEIRVPLEIQAASLAASRATKAEVRELGAIVEQHAAHIEKGDLEAASSADLAFHDRIAVLAGNPLLLTMYETMAEVLRTVRAPARGSVEIAQSGLRAHRWLLDCIAAGDAHAAKGAMERHLLEANRIWHGSPPDHD